MKRFHPSYLVPKFVQLHFLTFAGVLSQSLLLHCLRLVFARKLFLCHALETSCTRPNAAARCGPSLQGISKKHGKLLSDALLLKVRRKSAVAKVSRLFCAASGVFFLSGLNFLQRIGIHKEILFHCPTAGFMSA